MTPGEEHLLGSTKDFTWNGKMHECCGSITAERHYTGCKACGDGLNDELADTTILAGYEKPKLRAGAWRLDDETVRVMYALYRTGVDGKPMSLAEIGALYGKTRQAVYDIFTNRKWPLRTKQKKGLTIRYGISFTLDGDGRLRGTKDGQRVYLHRMVWEEANGPIPEAHVLTFRDKDRTNVALENLELVPMNQMQKRFNPEGRNQHTRLSPRRAFTA